MTSEREDEGRPVRETPVRKGGQEYPVPPPAPEGGPDSDDAGADSEAGDGQSRWE